MRYPSGMYTTLPTDVERILVEILKSNAASAHDIRGFLVDGQMGMRLLTELPDPEGQSIAAFAHDAVLILQRHGAIDSIWLDRLEHKYPHERSSINDVRRILSLPMRSEEVVSFDLLADNWAYEMVAELFAVGPCEQSVGVVQVEEDELVWRGECWVGVALESLLSILSGVVLRDRFFVEERYVAGWLCEESPVLNLHSEGMLVPFPEPEQVRPIRSALYRTLFHTPSLQRAHKKNIEIWRNTGMPSGGYDSQILWAPSGTSRGAPRSASPTRVIPRAGGFSRRLRSRSGCATRRALPSGRWTISGSANSWPQKSSRRVSSGWSCHR